MNTSKTLFGFSLFLGILATGYLANAHIIHFQKSSLPSHKITTTNLKAHVNFLCSNALEGRLTGSMGEKLATHYVANKFRELGLEPAGNNNTFFQEFDFIDNKQNKHKGRNVLAKLQINAASNQIIVIGAHIDHLGHGELNGSRAYKKEKGHIHYGADDNASGVASMIEAAKKLSYLNAEGKLHGNKNIVFAAWSGEEIGILGSSHFVHAMQKASNQSLHTLIEANLNLDMVGRLEENLVLQGIGSSSRWLNLIERANSKDPIHLITQNDPYLPTDSTSFYLQGVPTLNFFTGAHDEYHTPRDNPETLNYAGMKAISIFLVNLIIALENKQIVMDYKETPYTTKRSTRGMNVYLGTFPDYASSNKSGVKLAGVLKGSPAERAGVKRDDIIIELEGKKIHDIYDYTFVLSALHIGKPASLVVFRDKKNVNLTIIAQSRK